MPLVRNLELKHVCVCVCQHRALNQNQHGSLFACLKQTNRATSQRESATRPSGGASQSLAAAAGGALPTGAADADDATQGGGGELGGLGVGELGALRTHDFHLFFQVAFSCAVLEAAEDLKGGGGAWEENAEGEWIKRVSIA